MTMGPKRTVESKRPVEHKYPTGELNVHRDCYCVDCMARSALFKLAEEAKPYTDVVIQRIFDVVKLHPTPSKLRVYMKSLTHRRHELNKINDERKRRNKKLKHVEKQEKKLADLRQKQKDKEEAATSEVKVKRASIIDVHQYIQEKTSRYHSGSRSCT